VRQSQRLLKKPSFGNIYAMAVVMVSATIVGCCVPFFGGPLVGALYGYVLTWERLPYNRLLWCLIGLLIGNAIGAVPWMIITESFLAGIVTVMMTLIGFCAGRLYATQEIKLRNSSRT
jgi:hypothetical protein